MSTEPEARGLDAINPVMRQAWYIVATSGEVRGKPLPRRIHDKPLVVWRDGEGKARVFLDRCPHRNVPLSEGAVDGGGLRCGYHGWRFDGTGACVEIPALEGTPDAPARRATALPVVEQQGFVWVWTAPEVEPTCQPFRFACADDPRYTVVRKALRARGSLHATIENALDVPHTAFLHGGLFRRSDTPRKPIRCVIQRWHDRAECHFHGESAPTGLAARLLAPGGGELTHVDRFWLPSITEVEYSMGDDTHLVLNGACTPVTPWETIVFAVVSIRSPMPGWMVRPVVEPIALRIFDQDAVILAQQTDLLHTFGEARFASTEIDVLGAHILRMMRRVERGEHAEPSDQPETEKEVTMWL
ncbi:MAG: aromatic ring-hydroxylating dioxygenase subunit alpha [Alphaproteobacteria bacterium]|nr:aromatic ring-hydroxylating dioxygenase subunit alpha [Alphaproteobacteria bacterium]